MPLSTHTDKTYVMGTQIEIKIVSSASKINIDNILQDSINIFHQISTRYSRFTDSSELSIVNKSQGKLIYISPELFQLIKVSLKLYEDTKGVFDPTIIDFLEAYGYNKKYNFDKLNSKNLNNEIKKLVSTRPSFKEIQLNAADKTIKLAQNQKIDLGGIAKGYAIRKVKNLLLDNNFQNFTISAGGDVYANGYKDNGNKWKAALFNPQKSINSQKTEIYKVINLHNEAFASSGSWARKIGKFHHLINPQIGKPAKIKKPVFIKGKDPLYADALATICYLDEKIAQKLFKKYDCEKINV
ncbi:hypothetical protein GF362_07200 [Candidatus Dojkabacteria bacterium]|nr:hypothetical protein [Candidatus Dojkabacteria bacterium]